jgi:glutamate-1-semialdehyde 2,1-aminomutase
VIEQRYLDKNPGSLRLATRAREVCPGGVSQISRDFKPFAPYYERAAGTRKWTVDGQEIVDFCMGHGTLLFGHGHPEIQRAIHEQLAELICELVPSADRVRFCGTGSEACDLAIRVARAASGKNVFVKFEGHYHGWGAEELVALKPPYDAVASSGLPKNVADGRVIVPPGDLAALEKVLARDDIACVVVEPAGGTHGTVPTTKAWIAGVRELTKRRGVILIFDEMVTGFRLAPGGYQAWSGVTPDLTTLGKTLFGGLPGAAVVGRADLMDTMKAGASPLVAHFGTWNAFPVACAAGVVALRMLRDGAVAAHINDFGTRIRARMNDVIARLRVGARVFGAGSHAHFCMKPWPFPSDDVPIGRHAEIAADPLLARMLRLALFNEGCDFDFANNFSAVHGDAELELGVAGFEGALRQMIEDRLLTCAP